MPRLIEARPAERSLGPHREMRRPEWNSGISNHGPERSQHSGHAIRTDCTLGHEVSTEMRTDSRGEVASRNAILETRC